VTPDAKRSYHVYSRDWVTNEIFRRVEPKGRTMGEYFEQEIRQQLEVDVYLKMEEDQFDRIFDFRWITIPEQRRNAKLPEGDKKYVPFNGLRDTCLQLYKMYS
jgi:hypothetical protein